MLSTYFSLLRQIAKITMSSLVILTAISARAAETTAASDVTPVQVVDSLELTFGVHPGQRRNHTKGTCAAGEFTATPGAPALSRSQIFFGAPVPVVARFSVAGGNPGVPDATRNARGMALEFRLPNGSRQHMTGAFIQIARVCHLLYKTPGGQIGEPRDLTRLV